MINKIKNRIFYLDMIKTIAVFSVILSHTAIHDLHVANHLGILKDFYIRFLYSTDVIFFMMISGVLFYKKDLNIKSVIVLALKILLLYIIFSLFFQLFFSIAKHEFTGISYLTQLLINMYSTYLFNPYWYFVKWYIPFLLLLPLTRYIAKNIDFKTFLYFIIVFIFFNSVLSNVEKLFNLNHIIINTAELSSDVFFLPLAGYCIEKFKKEISLYFNKFILIILSIVSIVTLKINGIIYNYILSFIIFYFSAFYFESCKYEPNRLLDKIIFIIAKNSLFIYLFHFWFWRVEIYILEKIFPNYQFIMPEQVFIFLLAILTTLLTAVAGHVFSTICNFLFFKTYRI